MRSSIAFGLLTFFPLMTIGLLQVWADNLFLSGLLGLTLTATVLALIPSSVRDELTGESAR